MLSAGPREPPPPDAGLPGGPLAEVNRGRVVQRDPAVDARGPADLLFGQLADRREREGVAHARTLPGHEGRCYPPFRDAWDVPQVASRYTVLAALGGSVNVALRDAMSGAGVTRSRLARIVGVDEKTVDRWLASEARVPRAPARAAVAEALEVSAEMLWPKAVRDAIKTGTDREVVATYAYRNACPPTVWSQLIDGARRRIVFAGYTSYFLWQEQPKAAERLRAKAEAGVQVRFLLGDPESEVTRRREAVEDVPLSVSTRIQITLDQLRKLGSLPGLEARFSDDHIASSVFLFDDELLYTPHIANLLGHESPMLHLRRLQPDGLFDRFAQHAEALWAGGRPVPDVGGGS